MNTSYSTKNYFLKKTFSLFFLFFVFFPFITPIKSSTDMQPYSVIFALLLFPFFKFSLTKNQFLFFFALIVSFILFFFSDLNFDTFRSFYNYISLFLIYYISLKILKSKILNIEKFLKSTLLIWLIIALCQAFFNKGLFSFLISDLRTTENRGVTSLSPEPTLFAVILIFYLLFIIYLNFKNKYNYIFLIVIGILFLAKSTMGTLYLIVLSVYTLFFRFSFKNFLNALFLFISFIYLISMFSDSRLYGLALIFIQHPADLLLLDTSINDRFFQLFFSIKGFFNNYFIPHGFSSWSHYLVSQAPKYSNYTLLEYTVSDTRIMSALGSLLFELGFFGFLILYPIFKLNIYLFRNSKFKLYLIFIIIIFLLVSAIPIGFSYFGFYLALLEFSFTDKRKLSKV